MSSTGVSMAEFVGDRMRTRAAARSKPYLAEAPAAIGAMLANYVGLDPLLGYTVGRSADFEEWRLSLRSSNIEQLVRLNAESRANAGLVGVEIRALMAAPG